MDNKKFLKLFKILGIEVKKDLEENDLDYWHQKRYIEIQKSGQDKNTISKLLIELNNAKDNLDQYDLKTLKTKISNNKEQTSKGKENFIRRDINILYDQNLDSNKKLKNSKKESLINQNQLLKNSVILYSSVVFMTIVFVIWTYIFNYEIKERHKRLLISTDKCVRCNFYKIKFLNKYLEGANLRKSNLSFSDFRGVNLDNADLSSSNLISTNFSKYFSNNSKFRNANLSNANLTNADLSGADLRNANLKNADLSGTNLSNANLSNADLSRADLRNANLRDTNFTGANLSFANLYNSFAYKINLTNANLRSANLKYRNLILISPKYSGAIFCRTKTNIGLNNKDC